MRKNQINGFFSASKFSSKPKTLLNSPPLSVNRTGINLPKEKPLSTRVCFNRLIFEVTSPEDLLSDRIPIIKLKAVKWIVKITFPPVLPIAVSISTIGILGFSSRNAIKSS